MTIDLAKKAQLALLLAEKVTVPTEYSDFADVFLEKSANVLPEQTRANEHAIELEKSKQLSYGPIYSLGPVELKMFKTYIEINLSNGFIRASKSPAGALILFVRKPNGSLRLCVDYRGFNNLTIKNQYPLPLIGKSLDRLGWAIRLSKTIYLAWPHKCLSSDEEKRGQWMKDGFPDSIRPLQVPGNAFWAIQCTGQLAGLY